MNADLTASLVSAVKMLRRHAIRASLLSLQFFVSASVLLVVTASTLGSVGDVRLLSAVFDRSTVGVWQVSGSFVSQPLPLDETDVESIGFLEGVQAVAGCSESWMGLASLTELGGALEGTVAGTYEPPPESEQGLPVYGVSHGFASFFGLRVAKGRWLTSEECEQGAPVAVITEELAYELTGGHADSAELVGRVLALSHRLQRPTSVRIVGVLQGKSPIPGSPHPVADPQVRVGEPLVVVPNRTSGFRAGSRSGDSLDFIWVRFSPAVADADAMAKTVVGHLSAVHGAPAYEYCWKAKQVEDEWNMLKPILLALGAFGLGALILASFGLAGLSLVTVAQRRREVGLRQALGATRSDVAAQFALETVLPAALGTFLSLVGVLSVSGVLEKSLRFVLNPAVMIGTVAVVLGSCFLPGLLAVRHTMTMAPWDLLRGS